MGVQPLEQGKLYWWQEKSLINEYNEKKKFEAQVAGAKLK